MTVLAFAKPNDADKTDKAPLSKKSLTAFANAILKVTTYCNTVNNCVLPTLDTDFQPLWLGNLQNNLANMQGHCHTWIDTIGPSMTTIPQAIINYDNEFEGQYDTIIALLKKIGLGTPTKKQKAELLELMNALLKSLNAQNEVIKTANTQLGQFITNLSSDHTALTTGASSVTNAIKDDKDTVLKQIGQVKALKADIGNWNQDLTYAEIGTVGGIVVGLIGAIVTIVAAPLGILIIAVGVVGTVGAATAWGLLAKDISDATVEIQLLNNLMTDENKQIVILNSISDTVNDLVTKNQDAAKGMNDILADWSTIMAKMKAVIDDLEAAEGDIGSIVDIGDMKTTRLAWKQLTEFATHLQNGLGNVNFQKRIDIPTPKLPPHDPEPNLKIAS